MSNDKASQEQRSELSGLPFAAPARVLAPGAPVRWLLLGWRDFRAAGLASVSYGLFMALLVALVCLVAWHFGGYWVVFVVAGGFVFLAPLICTGLYALSAQLERHQKPSLRRAMRTGLKRHVGNEMVFALVLLVIFLVWARAGTMVHVFFPANPDAPLREFAAFLGVGSAIGAIFVMITFSASAFALPMIVHRRVDAVTAVVTSVNAVLRNRFVMLIWLAIALGGLLLGLLTACVGLVVILPVLGHAAWHGYLETVDASAFPRHDAGVTSTPRRA